MTLTRRHTLKLSIAALLAGISENANTRELEGTKVIVVGAGLSGLAAAQKLHRQGAEVLVLEAGDYVGGRLRTEWSMGAPFEHGAGWIHGPSRNNPTQQLARQVGARSFVTDDDNLQVFGTNGEEISDSQYERLDELYDALESLLDGPDWASNQSVHDMLLQVDPEILNDELGQWMLSAYFEFSIGAGIEDISAANGFASEIFPGDDVVLPEGYDRILDPLISGLNIRLNRHVSKITYSPDGVDVDGEPADYVICTVPLGVLKAGTISFDPPLPARLQNTIDQLGFGTVTKIALKFAQPFWDVETQYFGLMTEPKGRWNYWMNYRTFSSENILMGVSVGQYAPIADQMDRETIANDALDVLKTVWGDDVTAPQSVLSTAWSQDPNFYGAYSYPQTGGTTDQFELFQDPISDRLVFAGEHTAFDYNGTTHGALISGRRAADIILKT